MYIQTLESPAKKSSLAQYQLNSSPRRCTAQTLYRSHNVYVTTHQGKEFIHQSFVSILRTTSLPRRMGDSGGNEKSDFDSGCNQIMKEEEPFHPPNFPLSPPFIPPPVHLTANTLPGILPARSQEHMIPPGNKEDEPSSNNEEDYEDRVTLGHCLLAGIVLFAAMITAMFVMNSKDSRLLHASQLYTFDIESLLNSQVVGQAEAMTSILDALKDMANGPEDSSICQVLLLVGGPGVGKTFATQVIKDHFFLVGGRQCKDESHLSLVPKELDVNSLCVRLDLNLYSTDTLFATSRDSWKEGLRVIRDVTNQCKEKKMRMTMLVPVLAIKAHSIPSKGVQGVDSVADKKEYLQIVEREGAKIKNDLNAMDVSSKVVIFQPLGLSDVRQCILISAQQQIRAAPTPQVVDSVLEHLLNGEGNIKDFVPVGCKDVDNNVALLPPKSILP